MKFHALSEAFDSSGSEDSWAVIETDGELLAAAVADGVGSYSGGGIAARIAIDTFRSVVAEGVDVTMDVLFHRVREALMEGPKDVRLGTTLTAVVFRNGFAEVGHVGDCRIYQLRGDGLATRTKDQTELQHLLDQGVLNSVRARNYPRANVLLSVMAPEKEYELFKTRFSVNPGDRLIVCSDGFHRLVKKREIVRASLAAMTFDGFSSALDELIEGRELIDDATYVAVEI